MVVQELTDIVEQNIDEFKVPVYVIKDKVLMSTGIWKGYYYDANALKQAFEDTDWNSKEVRSLFLDHQDEYSREWIGEVKNIHLDGNDIKGDLVIVDENTAKKLAYGAKFGISPKVQANADDNNVIRKFIFQNFSVVITPAVKTAYINNWEKQEVENMEEDEKAQEETVEKEAKEAIETPQEKPVTPEKTEETTEEMTDDELAELERAANLVLEFVKKKKKKYPEPKPEEKPEEKPEKKKEYPYPKMSEETKSNEIEQKFSEKLDKLDAKIDRLAKTEKPLKKSITIENVGLEDEKEENVDLLMSEWLRQRVIG